MPGRVNQTCMQCQNTAGFTIANDGFFYCDYCGAQADDIIDAGVDEEHVFQHYSVSHSRVRSTNVIAAEPISWVPSEHYDHSTFSQVDETKYNTAAYDDDDDVGPTEPSDFWSQGMEFDSEFHCSTIRSRYLTGLQVIIQLQCEALVDKFNVSPLIVGLVGPIWLRFLASTGITADDWSSQTVNHSEAHTQGSNNTVNQVEAEEFHPSGSANYSVKFPSEPFNLDRKRLVIIWFRSLSSRIPLSCSLAISFLVCHVAREAILPTDMLRWTLEGKLPYLSVFDEIENHIGRPSPEGCPISTSRMFRPIQLISTQKLEAEAANIAQKIGLDLPPVNFYAIASRYCRTLSLHDTTTASMTKKILPTACQICEWCVSPELYLSANEFRIPTRVYVMSVLIVAIRILFDINGYGFWELSLSCPNSCSGADGQVSSALENSEEPPLPPHGTTTASAAVEVLCSRLNVGELLHILEAKYNELDDVCDFSCDLSSYIQYCKDVVFSGLQSSYEDVEEEKLSTEFWEFYQNNKVTQVPDCRVDSGLNNKRSRKAATCEGEKVGTRNDDKSACGTKLNSEDTSRRHNHHSNYSMEHDGGDDDQGGSASCGRQSYKDRAIRRMKLEMEENKFCYIPPRTRVKRRDYLHYARKRKDVYMYAVHADYYILLRSCAKVAQVETRVLHMAVLCFERRLKWLEKKMDGSLNLLLTQSSLDGFCDYCQE